MWLNLLQRLLGNTPPLLLLKMNIMIATMTTFEKLRERIDHYRWLNGIAQEYRRMINLINANGEFFTIYGFSYATNGDVVSFNVNPHRTIPYSFIKDGLEAALNGVEKEMKEMEIELKDWL